jgi:hypothetical protein
MHVVDMSAGRSATVTECSAAAPGVVGVMGTTRYRRLHSTSRTRFPAPEGSISEKASTSPRRVLRSSEDPGQSGFQSKTATGRGALERPQRSAELVRPCASAYICSHSSHRQSPCDSSGGCRPGPRGPAHVDRPGTALSPASSRAWGPGLRALRPHCQCRRPPTPTQEEVPNAGTPGRSVSTSFGPAVSPGVVRPSRRRLRETNAPDDGPPAFPSPPGALRGSRELQGGTRCGTTDSLALLSPCCSA